MITLSRRIISSFTAVLALGLALASSPLPAIAGSARVVDDDYGTPGACRGAGYATINAAVASFLPGQSGTIKVCPGTYSENVSISGLGRVKLLGVPGATIAATGATSLITATNTTRLTVQGFTLDGTSNTMVTGMVYFQNSNGVASRNVFQNSGSFGVYSTVTAGMQTLQVTGNQMTGVAGGVSAVSFGGAISAKVTGNNFAGVSNGVTVSALGGSATATVTGNRLQGTVYGIQLSGVTKARVSGNSIQDFGSGINLVDVTLSSVSHNKMRVTGYGIAMYANGAASSSNKLLGNTFEAGSGFFTGIYVVTNGAMAADLNRIKGNKFTDPGGLYTGTTGIYLNNPGGSISGTQIKGNKLTNIDTPYSHTGDTNTVISGNKCSPASPCVTP